MKTSQVWKYAWTARLALFTLVILAIEFFFGWGELINTAQDFATRNENPPAFLLVMGLGTALGVPLSACYLFAGASFGTLCGWGYTLVGLLFSGSLGYFLGKFVTPESLVKKFSKRARIDKKSKLVDINFFVRAIPALPYWTQNILLGGLQTDFKTYTLANILTQGAIALVMCFLGANLAKDGLLKYAAILLLIIAMFAIRKILKRLSSEKSPDENNEK